jgi:hypothetical protein
MLIDNSFFEPRRRSQRLTPTKAAVADNDGPSSSEPIISSRRPRPNSAASFTIPEDDSDCPSMDIDEDGHPVLRAVLLTLSNNQPPLAPPALEPRLIVREDGVEVLLIETNEGTVEVLVHKIKRPDERFKHEGSWWRRSIDTAAGSYARRFDF